MGQMEKEPAPWKTRFLDGLWERQTGDCKRVTSFSPGGSMKLNQHILASPRAEFNFKTTPPTPPKKKKKSSDG